MSEVMMSGTLMSVVVMSVTLLSVMVSIALLSVLVMSVMLEVIKSYKIVHDVGNQRLSFTSAIVMSVSWFQTDLVLTTLPVSGP